MIFAPRSGQRSSAAIGPVTVKVTIRACSHNAS
jgi:hypothetical protein